jgi:hypothetical protein
MTMEVDPYELLVRWYLRFNGYLGVENFVVHQTVDGGNIQVGEDDVLAVRFPHSREDPGFELETDARLLDADARDLALVDFVVAEVKGGRKCTLNSVWQEPPDARKIDRVCYVVQWLGPFADDKSIRQVATELQGSHRSQVAKFLFRVILFAHKRQPKLSLEQITFHDIADFLVHVRAPCWQDRGYGARSPHSQWHPLIREVWSIADPSNGGDPNRKIQAILEHLARAADRRARDDSAKV